MGEIERMGGGNGEENVIGFLDCICPISTRILNKNVLKLKKEKKKTRKVRSSRSLDSSEDCT